MALSKEELNIKIDNLNSKIEKLNAKIERWEKKKEESYFIKDIASYYGVSPKEAHNISELADFASKLPNNVNNKEQIESRLRELFDEHLEECNREIQNAKGNIDNIISTINTYKESISKIDNFDNMEKIPVIWEFLQQWKASVKEFVTNNAKLLEQLNNNKTKELEKFRNSDWYKKEVEKTRYPVRHWDGEKYVDKKDENGNIVYITRRYDIESNWEQDYYSPISSLTRAVTSGYSKVTINEKYLNQRLDEEIRNKYNLLVEQVTKIVTQITDASDLEIGGKGEIDGIIEGTTGKCRVWSTGVNLDGEGIQCPHFRLFCKRV